MKQKLIRITTVPLSLEKLLEGQLTFMNRYFEVTAVSAQEERLKKFGRKNGIKVHWVEMSREITPLKDLKSLFKLYFFLKKIKPLIVHTHTPKAGIVGMLAAKLARVPIRLHTVAGLPLLEAEGSKRHVLIGVEKLTYACATKVYPNSKVLHDIILKHKFSSPNKLKVLGVGSSNGIDTAYFAPEQFSLKCKIQIKNSIGIPLDDLVFVFVGRLVSDKGLNELIESFIDLELEYSDISLLLVGPFEQDLDPIKKNNFDLIMTHPKIFSVGYVEDVRPYFAVSDVLAFPSYREGFPNVVLQAGAMGVPSIVTDINGSNEIIEEGINGTIIPVKDAKELYKALKRMIEEPEWRKSLQQRSRIRITHNYERKDFWNLLLDEYKSLEKLFLKRAKNK